MNRLCAVSTDVYGPMWFSRRGFPELGLVVGVPVSKAVKIGLKSGVRKLSVSENRTILRLLVLTQHQRVTDRQTDTPLIAKSYPSTAERDKSDRK